MKILIYKITISILLLLLSVCNSNAQLISKKEFRLKDSKSSLIELNKNYNLTSKSSIVKNNSPFLAGSLSFIVPGAALGQLYNGQYLNFGIRLGISGLVVLGLALSGGTCFECGNDALIPLALLYTANWITSIFDAVIYNKKHLSGR